MYPDIRKHGVSPRLSFDEGKNAWMVKLVEDGKETTIYLDKEDADACIDNQYCAAFGTEIGNFLKQFK